MTAVAEPAQALDIRAIEQFLYKEARLADEHDYDAWEALWTDDAIYWVPAGSDDADPMTQMSVIFDNRNRISTRIRQLKTGRRYAQAPRSRLRRVVSNVEILGEENGDVVVGSNFMLFESKARGNEIWGGRYTHRLRVVDGEIKQSYKKIELVDNAGVLPNLAFLI